MKDIKIRDKIIGYDNPIFIIAEAGVNHNGNMKLAKKLVDVAVDCGVDAVKFQTFKSENLVTEDADMASYQERNIEKKESQLDMLKKLELRYNDFEELKRYCDSKNIIFLSTPHTLDAIDFLDSLVPAFKIGSGDLNNIPSLKYVAKKGKPIILSTGMSTYEEVKESVQSILAEGNNQIILLHCTTSYPCPIEDVNMKALITMKKLGCHIGYSDHTLGIFIPIMAVSLGAVVIEKHFTLDKNMDGPDHRASLNPFELRKMVDEIRRVEIAMGDGNKCPTNTEMEIAKVARKSLVARVDIPKSTIITKNMVVIKRPGTGIEPKLIDDVVGRVTKCKIYKDELITWDVI